MPSRLEFNDDGLHLGVLLQSILAEFTPDAGLLEPAEWSPGVEDGNRSRCTPTVPADISRAGRSAHSTGIAVRPYRQLSHPAERDGKAGDLETAMECVLHLG
jgi:hypothetical protein